MDKCVRSRDRELERTIYGGEAVSAGWNENLRLARPSTSLEDYCILRRSERMFHTMIESRLAPSRERFSAAVSVTLVIRQLVGNIGDAEDVSD